jgi:hypothetical protein
MEVHSGRVHFREVGGVLSIFKGRWRFGSSFNAILKLGRAIEVNFVFRTLVLLDNPCQKCSVSTAGSTQPVCQQVSDISLKSLPLSFRSGRSIFSLTFGTLKLGFYLSRYSTNNSRTEGPSPAANTSKGTGAIEIFGLEFDPGRAGRAS